MISIVVPCYNEAENIEPLYYEVVGILSSRGEKFEFIFIDDGSTDDTKSILEKLAKKKNVVWHSFDENLGKSAALQKGFEIASGEIVVQLDGDNQYNPTDILRFIAKLKEGYDLVNGWRAQRYGTAPRLAVSKVYNVMSRIMFGVSLRDMNCGFKVFRKTVVKNIKIGHEMHRYIPILAHLRGYKVTELDLHHRPRLHGESKYGMSRIFWGMWCMLKLGWSKRKLMNASKREEAAGSS